MSFFHRFTTVRLINLVTRKDRLKECQAEFARHDLDATPVIPYFAVKPTTLPSNWEGVLGLGVYGCFLSHLTVLREFMEFSEYESDTLLVMEDDIKFVGGLSGPIPDADIVYYGRLNHPAPAEKGWTALAPTNGVVGLHCYSVNRITAARLVAYLEQVIKRPDGHPMGGVQHVDGAVSMFRALYPDVKTVLCSPYLASQRSSATDLHESYITHLNALPIVGPALNLARKLKNRLAS
jgi:glycosyl transferase, family 25